MKIHFVSAETPEAAKTARALMSVHGQATKHDCDVIVVLGGDGTMLETIHAMLDLNKPVYGMNRGSLGFLLNPYNPEGLIDRILHSHSVTLFPLRMTARAQDGTVTEALAFNEVSLLRQSRQAAKIGIAIDNIERLPELICDGILVATPAGSTAYNLSAHGPIIPLVSNTLALTPISAFRPRRWRGALLPSHVKIRFEILESDKRPVSATADFTEIRNVAQVDIEQDTGTSITLMFNPDFKLEERILNEQFSV